MREMITLRRILASLVVGAALLLSAQGNALAACGGSPNKNVVVCNGGSRPVLDLNFTTLPSLPSYATFTRTSAAWDFHSPGILTQFASGAPRLGVYRYDANSASWFNAGLDMEQAHTNLVSTSAGGFNGGNWSKTNATVTDSNVNSPGGINTGSTFADNSTSGTHIDGTSFSATNATVYTLSVYAKAGTANLLQITGGGAFSGIGYANFDLNAGTVAATGGTLVASGIIPAGNGWYRCWIAETATSTTSGTLNLALINSSSATRLPSYAGTGTTILIWQADVIAASLPLTPIPTTNGSVTVNAETLSIPTSSIGIPANPTGLTVMAKGMASAGVTSGGQYIFNISDGTLNNRFGILKSSAGTILPSVVAGGSSQWSGSLAGAPNNGNTISSWMALAANNFAAQVVGQTKQTQASGSMPTGLTTVGVGGIPNNGNTWNGTISRLILYNGSYPNIAAQRTPGL